MKNTALDNDWHRIASGTVRLLAGRAAIYFDMPDIDGTNARLKIEDGPPQALNDITNLRITAIVQSDERVVYEAEKQKSSGSSQTVTETRRDEVFRWVKRNSSSVYAGDGTGVVRDDAEASGPMELFARRLRERREPLMSGISASIPWLDWTYHLGERLDLLAGRDILLKTGPDDNPAYPLIEGISYEFVDQGTDLMLRVWRPAE